jgi:hypothetical protein
MCCWVSALSRAVCVLCCARRVRAGVQVQCSECGIWRSKDGHRLCWSCAHPKHAPQQQETTDPLAQIGENATQLMAALPVHSHHRAPLLNALSRHLPSTTAASLLHAAPSTIRNAKRKDYSGSDLLQDKYARGVKRQKTAPARLEQLYDFLAAACPTKSGERSVTFHQYTTDASLYAAYCQFTPRPLSFHTFYDKKRWLRVRRAGRYLGHFDCSRCVSYNKLQHKPEAQLSAEEALELRRCAAHRTTVFPNACTTSRCGVSSSRVSCSC